MSGSEQMTVTLVEDLDVLVVGEEGTKVAESALAELASVAGRITAVSIGTRTEGATFGMRWRAARGRRSARWTSMRHEDPWGEVASNGITLSARVTDPTAISDGLVLQVRGPAGASARISACIVAELGPQAATGSPLSPE